MMMKYFQKFIVLAQIARIVLIIILIFSTSTYATNISIWSMGE